MKQIKKFFTKLAHFIPTRLPIGMTDFNLWADSIITANDMPNNDSVRYALAVAVLHLESVSKIELNFGIFKIAIPMSAHKSKRYFAQVLLKGAAGQIAGGIMHEMKAKQEKEMARLKAEAEAAAIPPVSGAV